MALPKVDAKSGFLTGLQDWMKTHKLEGGLNPHNKRYLAIKNGGFMNCPNCGCPKARRRRKTPGKRSGLHCGNCGWIKG